MNKKHVSLLVWFSVLILLTGCRTLLPVKNVIESPFGVDEGNLSLKQVGKQIRLAASKRGWEIRTVDEGHYIGTLNIRAHTAVVDIEFDLKSFSITYRNSTNLRAKCRGGTTKNVSTSLSPKSKCQGVVYIHPNYNQWIRNLEIDIRIRLVNL